MGGKARWIVLALGVANYLIAAKAHGRQLRLEREMAGIWEVSFRTRNPPFVEALWQRERLHYWSTAAVVFVALAALRALGEDRPRIFGDGSWPESLVVHGLGPLTFAFVATGLASVARLATSARDGLAIDAARPLDWLRDAQIGNVAWWALSIALSTALLGLLTKGSS